MPNIRSSQIIVESLCIISDLNFLISPIFTLSLNKLFFKLINSKRLHKRIEFFLLIVPSRSPRIHKNLRTNDCCQYFRFLRFIFLNINNNKKMEILTLIVVSSWGKFHRTEINLSIDHLHFTLTSDPNILQYQFIWSLIVAIFLDCENLRLIYISSLRRYF